MRRLSLVLLVAAGFLAIPASSSPASVTLGSLAPGIPSGVCGGGAQDFLQRQVASGPGYSVPGDGTITSWSTNASAGSGQAYKFKIFRKIAEVAVFTAVRHDGPRALIPSAVNTFSVNIPVRAGDLIGINSGPNNSGCTFSSGSGDAYDALPGDILDGESGSFFQFGPCCRVNVSAVFAPSNTITLGSTSLNKKKGTATLNLTLPNAGELTASGNGVKAASAGGAAISKAVGAGPAQLLIKAKGKKKRKLNETGKVKLNVAITYTPTGGDSATHSTKVKLKKL